MKVYTNGSYGQWKIVLFLGSKTVESAIYPTPHQQWNLIGKACYFLYCIASNKNCFLIVNFCIFFYYLLYRNSILTLDYI